MSYEDIIRAWKDEEFRLSLSGEERAQLPDNPAGFIELADADLEQVAGGLGSRTLSDCTGNTCSCLCTVSLACGGTRLNGCWP